MPAKNKPSSRRAVAHRISLPNRITLFRLSISPLFFVLFMLLTNNTWRGYSFLYLLIPIWILFGALELSDMLDGRIARKRNLVSDVGKVLDPIADVLCHFTLFLSFVLADLLSVWLFVIIMYREFVIITFRLLMALTGTAFAAGSGGKLKTILFAIASIGILLTVSARMTFNALQSHIASAHVHNLIDALINYLYILTTIIFIGAVCVSVASLIGYIRKIRRAGHFSRL